MNEVNWYEAARQAKANVTQLRKVNKDLLEACQFALGALLQINGWMILRMALPDDFTERTINELRTAITKAKEQS